MIAISSIIMSTVWLFYAICQSKKMGTENALENLASIAKYS